MLLKPRFFLAALALSALLSAPAAAQNAGQLVGLGNKCVDVFQQNTDDGTPIVLFECTGNANQLWTLTPRPGESATVDLVGLGGRCLVEGPQNGSGQRTAVLGPCGTAQSGFEISQGDLRGEFKLRRLGADLCLDVLGSSTADGTPLILFGCVDQANQLWRLVGSTDLPAFFVPYARNNSGNFSAPTTLFAVRNPSDESVRVRFEFFGQEDAPGAPETVQERTLDPGAVRTIDSSLVSGFSSPVGWVGITAIDAGTGDPLVFQDLYGDVFQVSRASNFASGDRLVSRDGLCSNWHVRFFNGGDFNGGTEMRFFVPEFAQDSSTSYTVNWEIFNETGQMVSTSGFTSASRTTTLSSFAFPATFGVAEFTFLGGVKGHISAVLDALGRFSVGLEAECRD
ncbi:MAG: RICIN domain-containing protein [Acidobacteriota bacterium]